jgi:hypothetical protein
MTDREKLLRATTRPPGDDVGFLLQCLNDERARMVTLEGEITKQVDAAVRYFIANQAAGIGVGAGKAADAGVREAFRLVHVED